MNEQRARTAIWIILLAAAQHMPDLNLTLLWRGLFVGEIRQRIASLGIGERVTVIDETMDVNELLGRVHAAAIFASGPSSTSWKSGRSSATAAMRPRSRRSSITPK